MIITRNVRSAMLDGWGDGWGALQFWGKFLASSVRRRKRAVLRGENTSRITLAWYVRPQSEMHPTVGADWIALGVEL